nr:hypothetical protein [Tanacetum cinerariifolium]
MTNVNQGMSVEEIERVIAQRVANAIEAIAIYETKTNLAHKSMSQTERQEVEEVGSYVFTIDDYLNVCLYNFLAREITDEKDPKEDPAYYPADRGNNDDDESSNDDDDDDDVEKDEEDEEDKKEEEHLAPADPYDVSTDYLVPSS